MANHRELLIQAAIVDKPNAEELLNQFSSKQPLLFEQTAGIVALLGEIASRPFNLQPRVAAMIDQLFCEIRHAIGSDQQVVLNRAELDVLRRYHLPELWQMISYARKELRMSALSAAILLLQLDKKSRKNIPHAARTLFPAMEQWEVRMTLKLDLLAISAAWFPDLEQIKQIMHGIDDSKRMIVADLCLELPHLPWDMVKLLLEATNSHNPLLNASAIEAAARNRWFAWQVTSRAVDMLKEQNGCTREGALRALGRLGPYGIRAKTNVEAVHHLHPELVDEVLQKLGPGPRDLQDHCAL